MFEGPEVALAWEQEPRPTVVPDRARLLSAICALELGEVLEAEQYLQNIWGADESFTVPDDTQFASKRSVDYGFFGASPAAVAKLAARRGVALRNQFAGRPRAEGWVAI